MVSQTFSLGEDGQKGMCTKLLLLLIMAAVLAVAVIAGIFAFRSSQKSGCDSPKLDPNGLSNFTTGANTIAFSCFPGFFVDETTEEGSNILISKCVDDSAWEPEPPTCNYLPFRLDCEVNSEGLVGNITMMQLGLEEATVIVGLIDYTGAVKSEGFLNQVIHLSRVAPQCSESKVYNLTDEIEALNRTYNQHALNIHYEHNELAAYKKADVRIQMIFLDLNTVASIVSIHQGGFKKVMLSDLPKNGWSEHVATHRPFQEFESSDNYHPGILFDDSE